MGEYCYLDEQNSSHLKTDLFEEHGAQMKFCDISEGMDSAINKDLSNSMEYIKETVSFILSINYGDPLIQGAARDIMERARVGAMIVRIDSNDICWPRFKGW